MLKNAQQSATPPVTSSVPETIVAPTPQPNQDASAPADETPQFVAVEPESTSTASTDSVKIPILNPWEPRWDLEQVSVAP
jgi:hypothetical protein